MMVLYCIIVVEDLAYAKTRATGNNKFVSFGDIPEGVTA